MEDYKRIFKFYGKPVEDYQFWEARTQAALYAKEVGHVIEDDVLAQIDIDEGTRKCVASAYAIIIQGFGDKPLRLCLRYRGDPYKIWKRLRDRYAVSNTATRVQLQSKLTKLFYSGQVMGDYVDAFEDVFNRLDGMNSSVSEELQVAKFLSSFGDLNRSKFGHVISSLQNAQDNLSWETATARLLQAYEDAMWHSEGNRRSYSKSMNEESQALTAGSRWRRKVYNNSGKSARVERRRCFKCHQVGYIAINCLTNQSRRDKRRPTSNSNSIEDLNDDIHVNTANPATLLVAIAGSRLGNEPQVTPVRSAVSHAEENYADTRNGVATVTSRDENNKQSVHHEGINCKLMLDSDASDHMVPYIEWLSDVHEIPSRAIVLGDGSKVNASICGTLEIRTALRENGGTVYRLMVLRDVLVVPAINTGLVSISRLCDDGYNMKFVQECCVGLKDGFIEFYGRKLRGVFLLDGIVLHTNTVYANASILCKPALQTWHDRFGHASMDSISSGAVIGLDLEKTIQTKNYCSSCTVGKQSKSVLRTNYSKSKERGAVIHTDVSGPMSCPTFPSNRYFVSFIHEFSGYVTIVLIKAKSEVKREFLRYHAWLERRFNCTIKRVHSDNGGEFIALKDYLSEKGIEQKMAPSYSLNMNAIAERANRTIVEFTRSMIDHAGLPRIFWAEAVTHAARIRNLFFSRRDDSITSYELMHAMMHPTKPTVSFLDEICNKSLKPLIGFCSSHEITQVLFYHQKLNAYCNQ